MFIVIILNLPKSALTLEFFYIHFMSRTFSSCIGSLTTYIARVVCFPAFFNVFIYRAFADIFLTDRTEFVLDTSL